MDLDDFARESRRNVTEMDEALRLVVEGLMMGRMGVRESCTTLKID